MTNDAGSEAVTGPKAAAPALLHALGGGAAPPDLATDLRRLLRMPAPALNKLWQVLGPCLADEISKETERLLDVFCSAYGVSDDDLGRAIKACRFLILEAVKRQVPAAALGEDLDRLCPGAPAIKELLLAGYEPVRAERRQAVLRAAVLDHGKVLVGAQWRRDIVEASEQAAGLRLPVAVLTLQYREGAETKRITLQLLPEMVAQLQAMCGQMLPATQAGANEHERRMGR
jgi:hypothetical protein